jgi:integrase
VISPAIRARAGKREILVSLRTKDAKIAEIRYLKAHLASEEWLNALAENSVPFPHAPPSKVVFLLPEQVRVGPLAESSSLRRAPKPTAAMPARLTLTGALSLYLEEKRDEFESYAGREQRVRYAEKQRVIRYLCEALGADREVASLTRQDVRTFRDFLRERKLGSGSLQKIISIVAAIIQTALTECQIPIRNPFHRFHVANDVAAIDARIPLSTKEVGIVRTLNVNAELRVIVEILVMTGGRLNEIAGLEWGDVHFTGLSTQLAFIHIRPNATRRLKTASSNRTVPLLEPSRDAIIGLRSLRQTGTRIGPIFPRYGRSGGADAASAALMKALRKAGVTDKRKSIHSIRHSVKQALRDVGCPKDIRDAIQGHAANDVAENYGLGHSLETMTVWLERAAEHLGISSSNLKTTFGDDSD